MIYFLIYSLKIIKEFDEISICNITDVNDDCIVIDDRFQ